MWPVFKQSWHQGDQEPGALKHYDVANSMVAAMDSFTMVAGLNPGPFELCKFMQMAPHFREERRIVDDAFKAYAAIALFFDTEKFYAHELGKVFQCSKLLDQVERAKEVPDRRTHMSNKTMPKGFWKEWDKLLKDNKRSAGESVEDIFPTEWRNAIRPAVIRRESKSAFAYLPMLTPDCSFSRRCHLPFLWRLSGRHHYRKSRARSLYGPLCRLSRWSAARQYRLTS